MVEVRLRMQDPWFTKLSLNWLQVRLATELIKHNQSRTIQSDAFESDMNPCTPPPEDLSCSYLNFDDCSPTSAETEFGPALTEMCASSSSSISPECDPSMISEEDLDFWYNQSASDVEMNILEANAQYCSSSLPLSISGTAKKALHVPFVILQTNNTTWAPSQILHAVESYNSYSRIWK